MRPDFERLMDPARREHFVYRHFDEGGSLLYVGCSSNLDRRWSEHRTNGDWALLVARTRLCGPYTYEAARAIEREAIRTEDPEWNAQTPRAMAARAARRRLFESVYQSALAHGEPFGESLRLARLAVDSEAAA